MIERVELDRRMDQEIAIEPRLLAPDLPYSDLGGGGVRIQTLDLAEILGNKWFMLDDRTEPRDLFDLWAGLTRFGVTFDQVARGHKASFGWNPNGGALESVKRMRDLWNVRLEHQLTDLPAFDVAHLLVVTWTVSPSGRTPERLTGHVLQ